MSSFWMVTVFKAFVIVNLAVFLQNKKSTVLIKGKTGRGTLVKVNKSQYVKDKTANVNGNQKFALR